MEIEIKNGEKTEPIQIVNYEKLILNSVSNLGLCIQLSDSAGNTQTINVIKSVHWFKDYPSKNWLTFINNTRYYIRIDYTLI